MAAEPHCTPGLRAYQAMMDKNRGLRLTNQERLRTLKQAHGSEVAMLCSDDLHEFEYHAGCPASQPAGPFADTE